MTKTPSKTVEFLDALKALRGWSSDYRLGKELGFTHQTVTHYRTGRTCMSARHAIRVADALALPRAYVLACMAAEREKDQEVRAAWDSALVMFRRFAAVILLALLCNTVPLKTAAAQGVNVSPEPHFFHCHIYIMRRLARWRRVRHRLLSVIRVTALEFFTPLPWGSFGTDGVAT